MTETKVAERYPGFAGEEAQVIVVLLRGDKREIWPKAGESWPFAFPADDEGSAYRSCNALDASEEATPAIFVADRYGEIYSEYRGKGWQGRTMADEILQWLFFINSQCPECGVSEWPQ